MRGYIYIEISSSNGSVTGVIFHVVLVKMYGWFLLHFWWGPLKVCCIFHLFELLKPFSPLLTKAILCGTHKSCSFLTFLSFESFWFIAQESDFNVALKNLAHFYLFELLNHIGPMLKKAIFVWHSKIWTLESYWSIFHFWRKLRRTT